MSDLQKATELPTPTRPDKISIWPISDNEFGIDVVYRGATGYKRADVVLRQLRAVGATANLTQEPDQAWSVRFGPIDRTAMLQVLNGIVW